jgi:hypothetical protein
LDVYRKGGDSLQGRYHYYRLHPFSLAEMLSRHELSEPFQELQLPSLHAEKELQALDTFGGFPEPLLSGNHKQLRRWHNEKNQRLFREDIQSIEIIRELGTMQVLSDLLPGKAGSLLSINSLREDLEVSHRAVSHWLEILEAFYYHFRIYPFSGKNYRSLKKEPKLYLWDWSEVMNKPARFENLVASHLLKFTHFLYDREGYRVQLYYLRDVNQKEVDFLVTVDQKPWFAVEVKLNDTEVAPSLRYFRDKLKIPFVYQVVEKSPVDFVTPDHIRVISADRFLAGLV